MDIESIEQLFTAEQVAATLQVRVRRVYELIHAGELMGLRIGRYMRVAPRDLAAYLERSRTTRQDGGEVVSLARRS